MRISKLVGERVKETPSGVSAKSHALLLRAGYIKQVGNGIYSLMPSAQRVSLKIQNIIREEMNKVDGQEVLMPVVMPRELWEKSGRYQAIGQEMVRFKDRNNHDMLLGMTHEEAAVHLVQNTIKSYDNLPCMIYQFQTKFRDEARPRAGLLRVREFTMKDAYSFHTSQEDLERYYQKVYDAYCRIYKRMGMKNFVSVSSDTGMMGGGRADEFQLLIDAGEDNIVLCSHCDYKANMEVATSVIDKPEFIDEPLKEVFTGNAKTIDEVCKELNISAKQTIKAVCYAVVGEANRLILSFIRGDKEVNEAKLKKAVNADDIALTDLADTGLVKGNIGCLNLPERLGEYYLTIIFDTSLQGMKGMVSGANKEEYHIAGVNMERDVAGARYEEFTKVSEGDSCPVCGNPLTIKKGIEVGNIFQLGTKYSKSMGLTVHMPDGSEMNPIMGCYGIGIGRCLASIVEESSDEKGIVWPMSIAPWQIYLCPLRLDDERVLSKAEQLYNALSSKYEVLYDDRNVSAGVKFADSELMGIPVRVVVSPRSLENNEVEVVLRASGEKQMVALENLDTLLEKILNA